METEQNNKNVEEIIKYTTELTKIGRKIDESRWELNKSKESLKNGGGVDNLNDTFDYGTINLILIYMDDLSNSISKLTREVKLSLEK